VVAGSYSILCNQVTLLNSFAIDLFGPEKRENEELNLGAKTVGLQLMDNVELEGEAEKALPMVITKGSSGEWHRVNMIPLGCCAASQYASKC
jgi:hypothetical protein